MDRPVRKSWDSNDAATLLNLGKKKIAFADSLPFDENVKNAIANKKIVMADGSVVDIHRNRGGIDSISTTSRGRIPQEEISKQEERAEEWGPCLSFDVDGSPSNKSGVWTKQQNVGIGDNPLFGNIPSAVPNQWMTYAELLNEGTVAARPETKSFGFVKPATLLSANRYSGSTTPTNVPAGYTVVRSCENVFSCSKTDEVVTGIIPESGYADYAINRTISHKIINDIDGSVIAESTEYYSLVENDDVEDTYVSQETTTTDTGFSLVLLLGTAASDGSSCFAIYKRVENNLNRYVIQFSPASAGDNISTESNISTMSLTATLRTKNSVGVTKDTSVVIETAVDSLFNDGGADYGTYNNYLDNSVGLYNANGVVCGVYSVYKDTGPVGGSTQVSVVHGMLLHAAHYCTGFVDAEYVDYGRMNIHIKAPGQSQTLWPTHGKVRCVLYKFKPKPT